MSSRAPAVADLFYPGDPAELAGAVCAYLDDADLPAGPLRPKALIVPHAGYVYSGPVAATAYRTLEPFRDEVQRVVLMGPAHRVYLEGLAVPEADAFTVPTGTVAVDANAVNRVLELPGVVASDQAHAPEHSGRIEVPQHNAVGKARRHQEAAVRSEGDGVVPGGGSEALEPLQLPAGGHIPEAGRLKVCGCQQWYCRCGSEHRYLAWCGEQCGTWAGGTAL